MIFTTCWSGILEIIVFRVAEAWVAEGIAFGYP
jgi:hypothetical protein